MSKLNDFYQKKKLMAQLQEELQALEESEVVKKEQALVDDLKGVLEKHDRSPREVLDALKVIDPSISKYLGESGKGAPRAKRPMLVYKNPNTGEVVKTRGGNHKTLKEWRDKYGPETVQSWKETAE